MHAIEEQMKVPYTAHQMYVLVNDVEHYPHFLKWCQRAQVEAITATTQNATLWINYHGFTHPFTTHNTLCADQSITMELAKGPFRYLEGKWTFEALAEGCHITFCLRYAFAVPLWSALLSPIFDTIAQTMVGAFAEEAQRRHRSLPTASINQTA